MPDGDADRELNGDLLFLFQQVTAGRPNGAYQRGKVIKHIIARNTLKQPDLPLA